MSLFACYIKVSHVIIWHNEDKAIMKQIKPSILLRINTNNKKMGKTNIEMKKYLLELSDVLTKLLGGEIDGDWRRFHTLKFLVCIKF